ncbi:hypothetical protein B0H11DRAFT_1707264, partial [Mycena galericulata]
IIYADNLELLTKMFWWLLSRLAAANLPAHLVDIIHAGLSEGHQRICLKDFRDGRTMFLLGSEKIGAGMNFRDVSRVIQFECKGLTLAKLRQRKGRGGRGGNGRSVMYLMPEKAFMSEGDLSVENPGNEDPGLIDLIQSSKCAEFIFDRWLENPPRDPVPTCGQCYRCCPTLLPGQEFEWIIENPGPTEPGRSVQVRTTEEEKEEMYQMLIEWRLRHWRSDWRDEWPSYGPKSLIPDSDLDNLAKHAASIETVDDLVPLVQGVVHWEELAPVLLATIKSIFFAVHGPIESAVVPALPPLAEDIHFPAPVDLLDQILTETRPKKRRKTEAAAKLGHGETIIDFSI